MNDTIPVKLIMAIPGPPVPSQRPRVVRGNAYKPAESRAYQKHVAWCIVHELGRSWTAQRRENALSPAVRWGVHMAFTFEDSRRRDLDNAVKAILDAGNGLLWRDDSLIDELHAFRCEPSREKPGVVLTAWVLP